MNNTPQWIIIHCSDVSYTKISDQFVSINAYHRDDREFPVSSLGLYVGYHRLITGGKNYKCREDWEVGAHCNQKLDGKSMNTQSLGICVGFDGDIEYLKQNEYDLLKAQVNEWQNKYAISNDRVVYHHHFATEKTCAGSLLGLEWMVNLLKKEISVKTPEQCEKQEGIIKAQNDKIAWYKEIFNFLANLNK